MSHMLTKEEVAESFEAALKACNVVSVRRRFKWSRLVSWLALPFVAAAMVIVPLFGGHLCPEEVIPMLAGAASMPFVGPAARALIARLRKQKPAKVHCCDETHTVNIDWTAEANRYVEERRKHAKPLPDIDLDKKCDFPGCSFIGSGAGHNHLPPAPTTCSDGHVGCRGDDAFVENGGLCYCTNIRGIHGRRVSCPPKEA